MSSGLESLLAAAWIVQRLSASVALASALKVSSLTGRIWQGNAPLGAAQPFVVFHAEGNGNDVQGVGAISIMVESTYIVRVVAQTADVLDLARAASALHTSIHRQRANVVIENVATGVVSARRERLFYQEYADESGHPYRALGGVYQLFTAITTN